MSTIWADRSLKRHPTQVTVMFRPLVLAGLLLWAVAANASSALSLRSAHAVVVDEATGEVLFDKDGGTAAPIASLTKLMTAMVVLDAHQDPEEQIRVTEDDLDKLKHTHGGIRPGLTLSRAGLLELALIASDNHAATALARHYPGGLDAFVAAVQRKIQALGLGSTVIEEPTGLSANNRSSALDMVKIMRAAADYSAITDITSKRQHVVRVNGRNYTVRNTNKLVGAPGWNILLSKTGFTNEAGRCLAMRLDAAGRNVAVVLMGAMGSSQRTRDVLNIRRWLTGEPVAAPRVRAHARAHAKVAALGAKAVVKPAPTSEIVERVEPLTTAPTPEE
jgi:D-alanyl-D-alanine carboxypeptidase/D-alanyl-D-alanine endopeptidase (penicillin-binding protein 7)